MRSRYSIPVSTALILGSVLTFLTSCEANHSPITEHATSSTLIPQTKIQTFTTATPVPLPFATTKTKRWNSANNGTPYEPCNALTPASLLASKILPETIQDAASVDGQTIRGCMWDRTSTGAGFSQVVVNSASLTAYKHNEPDNFLADIEQNGRTIGVATSATQCFTYVQSYRSGVITAFYMGSVNPESYEELCQNAIRFTRANLQRIPIGN
ncbi:DUF3558 family protein [Williamsia sterculiae]|uniref:DUF3558 domain-containing protein n=1 Tax=Williamsia sterculiae TaxID=1344003 RepID=A0A1N7GVD9_9NOCA|nr:Protein of unknown function [Williamsia sterculiae]